MKAWPAAATALAGIALVFASQYSLVDPTNFGGFDEWLIQSLDRRGLWSFPHSNRPFQLAWNVPWVHLFPCGLTGYYLANGTYLASSGWLLFLLARRIVTDSTLAFLAGAFCAAWAPLDMFRLDAATASIYTGVLLGALLTLLLFVTAVERESVSWLAAAGLMCFFTARCYEGVLGLSLIHI